MKRPLVIACLLVVLGVAAAVSLGVGPQAAAPDPALPDFKFERAGADTPEAAATALFRGCALGSPRHFVQHLLLGVCDGPIATLNKFAECLHVTKFRAGDESFTLYDLPKGIDKETVRVVASREFDGNDGDVKKLQLEAASTYSGKKFMAVDVAATGYDGREYATRIVVATVDNRWYAIPRCRSARSFYRIADAMP